MRAGSPRVLNVIFSVFRIEQESRERQLSTGTCLRSSTLQECLVRARKPWRCQPWVQSESQSSGHVPTGEKSFGLFLLQKESVGRRCEHRAS